VIDLLTSTESGKIVKGLLNPSVKRIQWLNRVLSDVKRLIGQRWPAHYQPT